MPIAAWANRGARTGPIHSEFNSWADESLLAKKLGTFGRLLETSAVGRPRTRGAGEGSRTPEVCPGPQPFKSPARGNRSSTATGWRAGGRGRLDAREGAHPARPTTALAPPFVDACPISNYPAAGPPIPRASAPTTRAEGRGGGSPGCMFGRVPKSRAPPEFPMQLALWGEKNTRAAANGSAERARALPWPRPALLEGSPGPTIGSRNLSLASAASRQGPHGDWFRPGAKCNAGKARVGTPAAGCYFRGFSALSPAFLSPQARPPAASHRYSLRWGVQRGVRA